MKNNSKQNTWVVNTFIQFILWGIFTFMTYMTMKNNLMIRIKREKYIDVQFCTADMLDTCYNSSRFFLMIIFIILIIHILKLNFRNIVMVQFKSRQSIFFEMNKKIITNALFLSFCATAISVILGIILADSYECNWNEKISYMYEHCGTPLNPNFISTGYIIFIFAVNLFFVLLVVGMFILLCWYLINPIIGVLGVFIIYGLEIAIKPPILKIFFNYIDLSTTSIFFYGVNYFYLILYPVILCVLLSILNMLVIKKKDLLY